MRKPETREKFKAALAAIIQFYGRRDIRMVAEVLDEEATTAKGTVDQRELNRIKEQTTQTGEIS